MWEENVEPLVDEQYNCGSDGDGPLGFIMFFESDGSRQAYVAQEKAATDPRLSNGMVKGTGVHVWVIHSYDPATIAAALDYGGDLIRPVRSHWTG